MQMQDYLRELSRVELLEKDEEEELWRRCKEDGDIRARQRLIESYQPLVFKLAMPFRPMGNIMDIIQEGTVGLIEATEAFDFRRGVAFSLYATHRIRGRMLNFVEREGRADVACMDGPMENGRETIKEGLMDLGVTVQEQVENHELLHRIHRAMDRLPVKERMVLESVYINSEPVKDVAKGLQVSTSCIYRLQKRGIRRVRGMLSRFMRNW